MENKKNTSPWAWIPSLYLAQGLPYVAVMVISVIMYKRMGISNTDIALYTSWLYLPWVLKPLWSPFVDILKTKRWWIFTMQLLIGAGFAGIAFTIPVPFFFQATLAFFWLLAFSSATHDIAADGFYMLGLDTNTQAKFVGIRSMFYRIATILSQGALVVLAGVIETTTSAEPLKIPIEVSPEYTQSTLFVPETQSITELSGNIRFVVDREVLQIGTQKINKDTLKALVKEVIALNEENGFIFKEAAKEKDGKSNSSSSSWSKHVSEPFGHWIKNNFGEKKETVISDEVGNIGILSVHLSKKPEAGKEKILNTSSNNRYQSITMLHGERLIFNENNWNKPAYMVFQADSKLTTLTKTEYKGLSGNIPFAWSVTFLVLAGLFILFSLYHRFVLPKPAVDVPNADLKASTILKEFGETFVTFFKKPHILTALFFMLTFRLAEAQIWKLLNPFLLDSVDKGGLGLSTGTVGIVYGTMGIIGLTCGGILGGIAASRGGLKKWLWPMTLIMVPNALVYVLLSYFQTGNLLIISSCVMVEQFCYGFGFTAYMLYMMYFCSDDARRKTAHYAICTGFMALGMMLPGMVAGWIQEQLGYHHFFIWVLICAIVPIIAVSLLKVDPAYGKKKVQE